MPILTKQLGFGSYSLRLMPLVRWHSVGKVIEREVSSRQNFRKHYDLPCMHGKVLGHVKHSFETVDIVSLNCVSLKERVGFQACQDLVNYIQCIFEMVAQLGTLDNVALQKLRVSISFVKLPPKSRYNPLSSIAAEVKDQVSNAVGGCVRAPPNLFVTQLIKATLNFRQIVV